MQENVKKGRTKGKRKREECRMHTYYYYYFWVLASSEIMSWQGQLQVFTGGKNTPWVSVGGSFSART